MNFLGERGRFSGNRRGPCLDQSKLLVKFSFQVYSSFFLFFLFFFLVGFYLLQMGYYIVIVTGLSQVQISLSVVFSPLQHRKEKGSQDLDFLEKVDDEMNKGESKQPYVCV